MKVKDLILNLFGMDKLYIFLVVGLVWDWIWGLNFDYE